MKSTVAKLVAGVLVAVAMLTSSNDVLAQARPSAKANVLAVDPLGLLGINQLKNLSLQYEFRSSPTNSWAFRATLFPTSGNTSAFALGGAYRFFIADSRALTGLSVAPAIDAFFVTWGDETYTAFGLGGDIAYKWIFDNISLEPMFAVRQIFTGDESSSDFSGVDWKLAGYVGYAW